jgi:hypothetical protein
MTFEPLTIPLREDAAGLWRIGKIRVTFETVWRAWKEGADAEQIVMRFLGTRVGGCPRGAGVRVASTRFGCSYS